MVNKISHLFKNKLAVIEQTGSSAEEAIQYHL